MQAPLPTLTQAVALDPRAVDLLLRDQRRIAVIGAGGWIGRALLAGLFEAMGESEARRRIVCFGSNERTIDLGASGTIVQRELAQLAELPREPTVVFHLAFLTMDKVAGMADEAYVAANRDLSRTVHDGLDAIGADSLFVASSGAAAFADVDGAAHDLRLYGRLKREDEELFADWANAAPGRRAVIARIFSLSGPFINKPGTYALASFILDALAGRPVEVRAPRRVIRSYVAVRELLSLALAQLLAGEGEAVARYDSGGEPLELEQVAEAVVRRLGGRVERAAVTDDRANAYFGDAADYERRLAAYGIGSVPLFDQIADTAATLAGMES